MHIYECDNGVKVPHDTVLEELRQLASQIEGTDSNLSMAMAIYLLGFSTYEGFSQVACSVVHGTNGDLLKRLYEYAKIVNTK